MTERKVAAVTGAGAGIGRAIALKLASQGHNVVVSDIDEESGRNVVAEIVDAGGKADFIRVDASSPEDSEALVQFAVSTFGGLHYAVNNAGVGAPPNRVGDIDVDAFDRAIAVTLRGTFLGMRAQLRHMDTNGGGVLVNVVSIGGLQATPMLAPYISAKHGVVGLTQSAALEYADRGIRINGVAPGPVETAAFETLPSERKDEEKSKVPMKRLGQPDEIADATAWLLSDQASFVNGVILPVDGGSVLA